MRIVLCELASVELRERARAFDPGRPAAHHDDVERAVVYELRVPIGFLPALEDVVLEPQGVGKGVHREPVLRRSFGPEEVHLGPEPEDQVVVRQRFEVGELHLPRVQIHRLDGRLMNGGVLLVVHEVTQRVADRGGLEQAGGELVQKRLKGVVVVLVDQHDVGVGMLQLVGGADPCEPSAEDDDPLASIGAVFRRTRHLGQPT